MVMMGYVHPVRDERIVRGIGQALPPLLRRDTERS